jgi:hypothetical protein
MEVGNATNPLGVGTAGLISEGFISVMHSTAPAGKLPQFVGTLSTVQLYAYYIVVNSSIGISAPYLAGWAYQSPPITVKWAQPPAVNGGTLTYDLLRQAVSNLGGNTAAPYGTGNFKVTASVSCANGICSAVDTGAATTSYTVTVPSTYAPALTFWPGSVILTGATDTPANNGGEPRLYTDIVGPSADVGLAGFVNSYGANVPTVFAHQCSVPGNWSSIWMSCPAGDSVSNSFAAVGALVLQYGTVVSSGQGGGLKGRLNFLMSPNNTLNAPNGNTSPATHLITLGDSNGFKTLATPGHRPTNDANDTWIGLDNADAVVSQFQLAFGAPVSISSYIGNVGDNTNFLERLDAINGKTFNVPIIANQPIKSTVTTISGLAPFTVLSTVPVANLASQFAQGLVFKGTTGNIGGSLLNAGQCTSGTATVNNATTSMTAIASPSANPLATGTALNGLAIWAYVSALNTVTVEICAIVQTTPNQTTYNVRVSQ